jgi:hypothetical protein
MADSRPERYALEIPVLRFIHRHSIEAVAQGLSKPHQAVLIVMVERRLAPNIVHFDCERFVNRR